MRALPSGISVPHMFIVVFVILLLAWPNLVWPLSSLVLVAAISPI